MQLTITQRFKIYENIVCLNDVTKNRLTTLRK